MIGFNCWHGPHHEAENWIRESLSPLICSWNFSSVESLSKSDYNLIHKDVAKKLLSTSNEKWNTIPRTYSEIDTLRAKFEKQGEPEKLKILDEINAYVEELEKHYSSV